MKTIQYLLFLICCIVTFPVFGNPDDDLFQHKIVAGYNLGATSPVPIPAEVRAVEAWWPQFTPQLGYSISYKDKKWKNWGIGSGIFLDYKGMGVRDKVKYMHTSIELEEGNSTNRFEGYFVGKNKTEVKIASVMIPLNILYEINDTWTLKAGGYFSYIFSSEFTGSVWDGYIRVGDPTGEKIEIGADDKATFNFSDDMKDIDFGIFVGTERKVNERFGIFGNFSWGLTSVFPSDFKVMEFKMRNIYLTLGLTYKL